MRIASAIAAAALLFAPAGGLAAKPVAKAPTKVDWSRTYSATAAGGFVMGNPGAKVALVEYGSLTCPHCGHFAETGFKPLVGQYVRSGKVSYEFRPFLLNGVDLAATLVARCNGPAHFFPVAEQLYATQGEWAVKPGNLPEAEQKKLQALPQGELMVALAKVTGLLPIAAAHGIPPARAEACLKDEAAANALVKIEQAAHELGVHGTPTFFVNGKQVPAYDWPTLEPFLKEGAG